METMPHHVVAGGGEGNEEDKGEEADEADVELDRSHRRTQEDPSD
jgi:hypothetical protein